MTTEEEIENYKTLVKLYKAKVDLYVENINENKIDSEDIIDLSPSVDCNGNKIYAVADALPDLTK